MKKLILIGAGGYAKSVIDSLDKNKYELIGFIDEIKSGEHLGYKILGNTVDDTKHLDCSYFISIGDNQKRKKWFERLIGRNLSIINVIDKSSIVSKNVRLGIGVFIGKLAIVNSDVTIGDNVIINTKALMEHGTSVGKHSNISTNTTINGDTKIGEECFIGSSSVVNGQLKIGNRSIIGSGAVVIRDVRENITVAGVPAKEIKENK